MTGPKCDGAAISGKTRGRLDAVQGTPGATSGPIIEIDLAWRI
jgi:hypothetical protein